MKDEEFEVFCQHHGIAISDNYVAPSADEFKALLKSYNLTGSQAGRLTGVTPKQMRKYTGGMVSVPYSVLYTLRSKLAACS